MCEGIELGEGKVSTYIHTHCIIELFDYCILHNTPVSMDAVRDNLLLKIGCLQTPHNLELNLRGVNITLTAMKGVRKGVRGDN